MGKTESTDLDGQDPLLCRDELRPPLSLSELLELLVKAELVSQKQATEIESRTMTLRSQVLDHQPEPSYMRRIEDWFFSLLPMEDEL